jgi:hypothetical protein
LQLRIQEDAAMEVRGPDVIVKVRLDPGVVAQVWSGTDCTLAAPHSTSISANGTYAFPALSFVSAGDDVVCLATSDQRLRRQVSLR